MPDRFEVFDSSGSWCGSDVVKPPFELLDMSPDYIYTPSNENPGVMKVIPVPKGTDCPAGWITDIYDIGLRL